MKSYRNVFYHEILDRHRASEILDDLVTIEFSHDIPENVVEEAGDGENTLRSEERLESILSNEGFPPPTKQHPIPLTVEGFPTLNRTVPDFVYIEKKVAIYLDGMSGHLHGNSETALVDRLISDKLDELGWEIIRIQYPELNDPQVMNIYFRKLSRYLGK
jgi:hypothetical protein